MEGRVRQRIFPKLQAFGVPVSSAVYCRRQQLHLSVVLFVLYGSYVAFIFTWTLFARRSMKEDSGGSARRGPNVGSSVYVSILDYQKEVE